MDDESFMEIDKVGNIFWRNRWGVLHRLDGPAIEYSSGAEEWWQNGKRHRIDGPAVEWRDSAKEWFQNGKLHRLDGPAIEGADGRKLWYQNGKLHRVDGPALIKPFEEKKEWWIDGWLCKTKEDWFDALPSEAKAKCLFSEDFLNA